MVELVLVFCLIGSSAVCQEERPAPEMIVTQCSTSVGQVYADHWLDDHPKWELARVDCRRAERQT